MRFGFETRQEGYTQQEYLSAHRRRRHSRLGGVRGIGLCGGGGHVCEGWPRVHGTRQPNTAPEAKHLGGCRCRGRATAAAPPKGLNSRSRRGRLWQFLRARMRTRASVSQLSGENLGQVSHVAFDIDKSIINVQPGYRLLISIITAVLIDHDELRTLWQNEMPGWQVYASAASLNGQ